ncbi:MAG: radical SAM protein [Desulfuromonadaceae bacterium]
MPRTKNDLLRVFNSPELVELRSKIVAGDPSGTPCDNCENKVKHSDLLPVEVLPNDENARMEIINSFHDGRAILNYLPPALKFQTSKICNINCIMCNQKPLQKKDYEYIDVKAISALFENIPFREIANVLMWGGEPLFAKDALHILNMLSDRSDTDHTRISIITNGTMIENNLPLFNKLKKWHVAISLDAVGDLHGHIRRGASFEKLDRGIRELVKLSDGMTRILTFNAIIMKSTLRHTEELIGYVSSLGVSPDSINFMLIRGGSEENFLYNKKGLSNIKVQEWKTPIQACIQRLRIIECNSAANSLSFVYKQIRKFQETANFHFKNEDTVENIK